MKRVLVEAIPENGALLELSEEEHRHLQRVRRIPPGTILEILDGAGGLAQGLLVSVNRKKAVVRIESKIKDERESSLKLSLALAVPHHKSTLESLLPGLVQLGVNDLHLFYSQFSGRDKGDYPKQKKRFDLIAKQAIKQCGRLVLPQIHAPKPLTELIPELASDADAGVIFHPDKAPERAAVFKSGDVEHLALLVGPEGGLTTKEYQTALEAGWVGAVLGKRILRMETAATGACFWAQAMFGDYLGMSR